MHKGLLFAPRGMVPGPIGTPATAIGKIQSQHRSLRMRSNALALVHVALGVEPGGGAGALGGA